MCRDCCNILKNYCCKPQERSLVMVKTKLNFSPFDWLPPAEVELLVKRLLDTIVGESSDSVGSRCAGAIKNRKQIQRK